MSEKEKRNSDTRAKDSGLLSMVYSLGFLGFGVFYLPFFLMKLRQASEPKRLLRERFGNLSEEVALTVSENKTVWIHAVSVGEVMAAKEFIRLFAEACPQIKILLTTVTPTGQRIAQGLQSDQIQVAYIPFDFSFAVRKYMKEVSPICLLLMETEIWPNLLTEASKLQIPVGILNARLSPRSLKRYLRFKNILQPVFNKIDFVLSQTEEDAERFKQIGIPASKVQTLGNMKFDNVSMEEETGFADSLKQRFEMNEKMRVFLAGSTHPGEEEMLASVLKSVRNQYKEVKLVIAPRHIERADTIKQKLEEIGFRVQLSSHFLKGVPYDVMLVDELGILKNLYAIADVVFVGGSLVPKGGQNPIEPAALKRAILHGPYTHNFKKVYQMLDDENGAQLVQTPDELSSAVKALLYEEREAESYGRNAFRVVSNLRGASERHVNWILEHLSPELVERETNVEQHEKLFSPAGARI